MAKKVWEHADMTEIEFNNLSPKNQLKIETSALETEKINAEIERAEAEIELAEAKIEHTKAEIKYTKVMTVAVAALTVAFNAAIILWIASDDNATELEQPASTIKPAAEQTIQLKI